MSRLATCARVLAFLALLVFAAPPAGASTIRVTTIPVLEGAPNDSAAVQYLADGGETNDVTVSLAGGIDTVTDTGAVIHAEAGCASVSDHTATCPAPQSPVGVAAWLGDGDDRFTSTADSADFIQGDDGNDIIDAGPGADFYVSGGPGVNTVTGGAGDDTVRLYPGVGTDDVSGGPGTDTLRFGWSNTGVVVTLDGLRNDGADGDGPANARDNIHPDVENLYGSYGDDHLTGSDGPNVIDGSDGNDTLDGAGGNDTFTKYWPALYSTVIHGGPGEDAVDLSGSYGGAGGTTIALDGQPHDGMTIGTDVEDVVGTNYADTIIGNASDNVLDGGIGTCQDSITGLGGTDTVSYAHAAWPVSVSLNGVDDDGAHGVSQFCAPPDFVERDHIATDVEAIRGGPFNDQLLGDAQANRLDGAAGDDLLDSGTGADVLIGGPGQHDTVSYASRATAVTAVADGTPTSGNADDGPAGARDRIAADVEDLTGGAGADTLTGNAADNVLDGGPGPDIIAGLAGTDTVTYASRTEGVGAAPDGIPDSGGTLDDPGDLIASDVENLIGGSGDDLLVGNAAANDLQGRGGSDLLAGLGGPDALSGGDGLDAVSYEDRTTGVQATIGAPGQSGNTDDGAPGARDTVSGDVEALYGGSGDDRLTGDAADNLLDGGFGADVLSGAAGLDLADYSLRTASVDLAINDAATSGNNDDGPPGARDTIRTDIEGVASGSGDDTLAGSSQPNYLDAGAGNDTIFSRDDGPDLDVCGDGTDIARLDDNDEVDGCETAWLTDPVTPPATSTGTSTVGGAGSTSPGAAAPTAQAPQASLTPQAWLSVPGGQTLGTVRTAGLRLRLRCSSACTITARVRTTARTPVTVGTATGRLTKAGTAKLAVRLTRAGLRRLRGVRPVRLALTVTIRGNGAQRTIRRRLTVTPKAIRVTALPVAARRAGGPQDIVTRRRFGAGLSLNAGVSELLARRAAATAQRSSGAVTSSAAGG